MKKRETNNSSMPQFKLTNTLTPYQQMKERMSWKEHGLTDAMIEEIYDKYIEWSKQHSATDPIDFRHEYGISRGLWHYLKKTYEMIALADEIVRECVGSRCRKLAMYKENECNEKTIHRTLHMYHPDWTEVVQHEEELRKELNAKDKEQKPTEITVVMPDYGSNNNAG